MGFPTPNPRNVKNVLNQLDDGFILWERINTLLQLLDDTDRRILNRLEDIYNKSEWRNPGVVDWHDQADALVEIFQNLVNTHNSVNDWGGEIAGQLPGITLRSQNAWEEASLAKLAAEEARSRLRQHMPAAGEGTIGDPIVITAGGELELPGGTSFVVVVISNIPPKWGKINSYVPFYRTLGTVGFGFQGHWGFGYPLRVAAQWIPVTPGADRLQWSFLPDIAAELRLVASFQT